MRYYRKIIVLLFLILINVPAALAHTPLQPGGENDSLETALNIPTPTKSWTLYRELHEPGEAEYFKLHLHKDERFVVSVYIPRNSELDFVPSIVVMGPSIEKQSSVPSIIRVPEGAEATLIEGIRPEAPEYEPFTPASYYYTAEYRADVTTEGDYYFAVYAEENEGRYGIAVGYIETFTLIEWLMIPVDVIGIHQWEGQSLALILAPMALTLLLGSFIIFKKYKPVSSVAVIIGFLSGLLYIGSGFMMITQIIIALIGATSFSSFILTMVLSILPIVVGLAILRKIVLYDLSWTLGDRVTFAAYGILGYALWAGLLVGPTLAIILSALALVTP